MKDAEKRAWFRQFVNTDDTEPGIEIISERGQPRPADWPSEAVSLVQLQVFKEHYPRHCSPGQGGTMQLGQGGHGARLPA